MTVVLLGTAACHLCEQAKTIVAESGFEAIFTDIALDEFWQAHYATRIPVLYHLESQQELAWPFDHAAVKTFVENLYEPTIPH